MFGEAESWQTYAQHALRGVSRDVSFVNFLKLQTPIAQKTVFTFINLVFMLNLLCSYNTSGRVILGTCIKKIAVEESIWVLASNKFLWESQLPKISPPVQQDYYAISFIHAPIKIKNLMIRSLVKLTASIF